MIKTGFAGVDGREEELSEYMCDEPGCPNIATHALGIRALGAYAAVCDRHATHVKSEDRKS
jgi:hypothetical protein